MPRGIGYGRTVPSVEDVKKYARKQGGRFKNFMRSGGKDKSVSMEYSSKTVKVDNTNEGNIGTKDY